MEIGGYEDHPDWPKMGPSLLIATCLILAIRTAKWPAKWDALISSTGLDHEIQYAAHLAGRVLSALVTKNATIFPTAKKPWHKATEDEVPKLNLSMCGRYHNRFEKQQIAEPYRAKIRPSIEIYPSHNVAPQTFEPSVYLDQEDERSLR